MSGLDLEGTVLVPTKGRVPHQEARRTLVVKQWLSIVYIDIENKLSHYSTASY